MHNKQRRQHYAQTLIRMTTRAAATNKNNNFTTNAIFSHNFLSDAQNGREDVLYKTEKLGNNRHRATKLSGLQPLLMNIVAALPIVLILPASSLAQYTNDDYGSDKAFNLRSLQKQQPYFNRLEFLNDIPENYDVSDEKSLRELQTDYDSNKVNLQPPSFLRPPFEEVSENSQTNANVLKESRGKPHIYADTRPIDERAAKTLARVAKRRLVVRVPFTQNPDTMQLSRIYKSLFTHHKEKKRPYRYDAFQ